MRPAPHALQCIFRCARQPAGLRHGLPALGGERLLLAWLLCALLAAPLLGRLHALAHPVGHAHAHSLQAAPATATAPAHGLAQLLAAHPTASDCLLFDHLALADAAPSAAGAMASLPPPAQPVQAAHCAPATVCPAQYHARGPPDAAQCLSSLA